MYNVNLDSSEDSSFKSGDDSFEKEFDDIRSETCWDIKYLKKILVSEPSGSGNDTTFIITTVYQIKDDEQLKKVTRKYSEYVWLNYQLEKSFPGCLIPKLPTLSEIKKQNTICDFKSSEKEPNPNDISYYTSNEVTLSNYTSQVLSNERFRNFVKLKEFITNPEQIK